MPAISILIKGKVQGVFFRATALKEAKKLGLTGWIRNTDAGDVEANVNGDSNNLKLFLDWCNTGPKDAIVENVRSQEIPEVKFRDFIIRT